MSDDAFFSFLALAASALAIVVSLAARRDSKRSADAAEQSAREAEKAGKTERSDFLKPLFEESGKLCAILSLVERRKAECEKADAYRQSVASLRHILASDSELSGILDKLLDAAKAYDNRVTSMFDTRPGDHRYKVPENFDVLEKEIEDKKRQYLSIG